jgi:transposase
VRELRFLGPGATMGNLLVGIDVAKKRNHVCLVEQHGSQIGRVFTITNTRESLEDFLKKLDKEANARGLKPLIRLEATGVYCWPLLSSLAGKYPVQVFHPKQLKAAREEGIRKSKSDRVDSHTLATTSKQPPATDYSDALRLQIRELGRYREKLEAIKEAQWKRLMRNVFVKFPGLDDEYKLDTLWMRAFLAHFESPEHVVDAGVDEVARVIQEANGQKEFAKERAKEVVGFCKNCLTTSFVGNVLGVVNRQILRRINHLEEDIDEVEREMLNLWKQVEDSFAYPRLEGMDPVTAATIYGELGVILRYDSVDKITAASGLDPVSWQSGESKARVGRISRQGPPVLRKVLTRKVMGMSKTNPVIRAYFEKKFREEKKPYKVARTAAAKRLLRLIWVTENQNANKDRGPGRAPSTSPSSS